MAASEAETAEELKQKGNELFRSGDFYNAKKMYSAAIQMDPRSPALLTNRAACHIHLADPWKAVKDCDCALDMDRKWERAYLRKASALLSEKRYSEAEAVLDAGLCELPGCNSLKALRDTTRQRSVESSHRMQHDIGLASMSEKEIYAKAKKQVDQHFLPANLSCSPAQLAQIASASKVAKRCKVAVKLELEGKTRQAIQVYEECAEHGCTTSMDALGRIFHDGEGLQEPDHQQGIYWYRRCVDHGPSELSRLILQGKDNALAGAQGALGQAYRHGIGVERDPDLAAHYLKCGAEGGHPVSMNNYATLCAEMDRHAEAFLWYKAAADDDYPLAMTNAARALMEGRGTDRDVAAAIGWLLKAQSRGQPQASRMLAEFLYQGGTDPNIVTKQLEAVVEAEGRCGDITVESLLMLAEHLLQLQQREDDAVKMEHLIAILSALGISVPSFDPSGFQSVLQHRRELTQLLHRHRPPTEIETRACKMLSKAFRRGCATAGLKHARFLESKGMIKEALQKFKHIADKHNNADAKFHVGMIQTTAGPESDLAAGIAQLKAAAKLGHQLACHRIDEVREQQRNAKETLEPCRNNEGTTTSEFRSAQRENFELWRATSGDKLAEEEVAAFEQSMKASQIALSFNHPGQNQLLLPGSTLDHFHTMMQYMSEHPESFFGYQVMQALGHFLSCLKYLSQGHTHVALRELFYAYAFDEKVVTLPFVLTRAGDMELVPEFAEIVEVASSTASQDPSSFEAHFVKTMMTPPVADLHLNMQLQDVTQLLKIAETSSDAIAHRLRPKLYHRRGCLLCFRDQYAAGKQDFDEALRLLSEDESVSMWPRDPDLPDDLLNKFREYMRLEVVIDVGRAELRKKSNEDPANPNHCAIQLIQQYLDGMQHDSHFYVKAHFELFEAKMLNEFLSDPAKGERLILRAEDMMRHRLPIFTDITETNYPKMAQVKAHLGMIRAARKTRPTRFAEVLKKHATADGLADRMPKCWNCGCRTTLTKCAGCMVAMYCSRACQKEDWKLHKQQCKR